MALGSPGRGDKEAGVVLYSDFSVGPFKRSGGGGMMKFKFILCIGKRFYFHWQGDRWSDRRGSAQTIQTQSEEPRVR